MDWEGEGGRKKENQGRKMAYIPLLYTTLSGKRNKSLMTRFLVPRDNDFLKNKQRKGTKK